MSDQRRKALTYRIENIPSGTTKESLVRLCFDVETRQYITVKSLMPAVETIEGKDGDFYTATVLFHPHDSVPEGPKIQDKNIDMDHNFGGFTPLYVPPADKGPIAAE